MDANGPNPEGGEATITVDRPEHETLRVRLAGRWRLTGARPAPDPILAEAKRQPTRRVVFDATEVESWDTAILIFLDRLEGLAAERKLEVDRRGLPDGVERLMALTTATAEKEGARAKTVAHGWLAQVGTFALSFVGGSKEFLTFVGEVTLSLGRLLRGRATYRRSDFFYVLQETGAQALPIVTLIAFLVGLIMAFVGAVQLQPFGATLYVANGVAIAMAREMAAMMTAIIMAGRTGAAFAAQLGTMKVTEEIDAVTTMGLDPMDYLVLPRILALSLMMPLLAVYANAVGIVGGATVGLTMLDLSPVLYWQQTVAAVTLTHFATGLVKAVVFGVIVAVSGCLRGMQCGNSASAVGESATSAVVTCIVLIVITDGVFAVIFNVLGV